MSRRQEISVPPELLELLAKIENISRDEDNGPGRDLCPACFGHGEWNWKNGSVVSRDPIEHEAGCPLDALRALLDKTKAVQAGGLGHFCGLKIVEDPSLKPGEFRLSPVGKILAE